MENQSFHINLNVLSVFLFIIAAFTMFFSGNEVRRVNIRVQEQTRIEENRRMCEQESQALADASDYLTNQVWHFIANQRMEHLHNYWDEIYKTRSREQAIDALMDLSLSPEEQVLIFDAKIESDKLVEGEAWAMRLTADSMGLDSSVLPAGVRDIRLTPAEQALSSAQKRQLALDYIFGDDYTSAKTRISNGIREFRDQLRARKNQELAAAVGETRSALQAAQLFDIIMLFYLLLSVTLFYLLATRPFHRYAMALKHMNGSGFTPLAPAGSKETREFAVAFNRIYSDWESQKVRLEEERFRFHVAVENSSVVVYEYDPYADTYTAYGNLNEEESHAAVDTSAHSERIIDDFLSRKAADIVGEDGVEILRKLLRDEGGTAEVQASFDPGKHIWARVTATPIYGEDLRLLKLIGRVVDIQSEKEKEFALEDARSRDGLTGLYNKESGVRMVQRYMAEKSPEDICGLMILDMDDFALLNDAEGGVFADAILQDVADILRAKTGPDDILIRLGGDEFMLFIKSCPKSRATVLGPQIAAAIRSLSPDDGMEAPVSASIGMCVTEVVDEYSGLYRCAESTLKYVKSHGKGEAACYLDTSNELGMMLTQMYPDRHPISQIDRPDSSHEDIISFALSLLGKARHLDDAIALLLARVGKQYHFDRISIIEISMDYLSCHYMHQWAGNPADSQLKGTIYVSAEELRAAAASYDEEGLCDHQVIGGISDMQSTLHAAIWNHGSYEGIMSFELREPGHLWSEEERGLLSELVKIIASFCLKARADAASQAKTDFLSRMSHEIRTPMNAITGMTTIAKASLGNADRTLDCLNKIETATSYLLNLINDILDMSRIESGKMMLNLTPVDLAAQTADLDILVRPQAIEKGLVFTIKNGCDGCPPVMADGLRLNQVLVNLLGNAVKFTPSSGSVTLQTEVTERAGQDISIRFCVSDTGIGISEEARNRIFNAFEQAESDTASSYGGTGLGLSISSRLVQMMGGSLEVNSDPGKGSSFFFTVRFTIAPPSETATFGPRESESTAAAYDPHGKRVLLVEDNELNREIAREILEMNGFLVEEAANGALAAEAFRRNPHGFFDAILMDIRMPVMDGIEAARQIRTMGKSDSRTVPIIAMTANAFDEDMKKSLENGMNGHLSKPIEVDKLLKMLQKCIHWKR